MDKLLAAANDPRVWEIIFTQSPGPKNSKKLTAILKEYGIR